MKIRLPRTTHRTDRARWATARTMTDLGHLTADWLEGTLRHHPAYRGTGPNPRTSPVVPVLARLNRTGLVTANSQPGHSPTRRWNRTVRTQRAAVDGWTTDQALLHALTRTAQAHDLHLILNPPGTTADRGPIPVTCRNGTADHLVRRPLPPGPPHTALDRNPPRRTHRPHRSHPHHPHRHHLGPLHTPLD
ncbi:DUF6919 domain-containing protein, partial [Streptomyces clavuligerus]|uniref:DUF6919 domain-containing protein n=3 Tax=Streptomyces clavuligerus TaxID=1901 RepID=UPI003F683F45